MISIQTMPVYSGETFLVLKENHYPNKILTSENTCQPIKWNRHFLSITHKKVYYLTDCTKINIIIQDVVHPEETIKAMVGWRYTEEWKMVKPVNLWSSKKKKKKERKNLKNY